MMMNMGRFVPHGGSRMLLPCLTRQALMVRPVLRLQHSTSISFATKTTTIRVFSVSSSSSEAAAAVPLQAAHAPSATNNTTTETENSTIEIPTTTQDPVELVTSQLPKDYNPGHVLAVLNQVGKGGAELTHEQFRLLLTSARPLEFKDARVILTACVNYKRINRFLLSEELASDCIDQILRCDPAVGGLMILEHFTLESGLYYAAPVPAMHRALQHIQDYSLDHVGDPAPDMMDPKINRGAAAKRSKIFPIKIPKTDTPPPPPVIPKERIWSALVLFWENLVLRRTRPYKTYKKRKARRYQVQCQVHTGPSEETLEMVVEIAFSLLSMTEDQNDEKYNLVYTTFVQPCLDNRVLSADSLLIQELDRKRQVAKATAKMESLDTIMVDNDDNNNNIHDEDEDDTEEDSDQDNDKR